MRMDVHFFQDDNDVIWLSHITNLVVKNNRLLVKVEKLTRLAIRAKEIVTEMMVSMIAEGSVKDEAHFRELLKIHQNGNSNRKKNKYHLAAKESMPVFKKDHVSELELKV